MERKSVQVCRADQEINNLPNSAITIASIYCVCHCEVVFDRGNLFRKGEIAEPVPNPPNAERNLRVCFGFASQLHSQ